MGLLRSMLVLRACCLRTVALTAHAETPKQQHRPVILESVRKQPPLVLAFLREMPKGGDLHNHLARRDLRRESDRLRRRTTTFASIAPLRA